MNNNVELCSDWLFHSAAHFSSSQAGPACGIGDIGSCLGRKMTGGRAQSFFFFLS